MKAILVAGALANKYRNGGEAWVRLSWVLGFQKLGFQVFFVEQIHPDSCTDESGRATAFEDSVHLRYFKTVTEMFGISDTASLICGAGQQCYGKSPAELLELGSDSELLVNISGNLKWKQLLSRIRRKAYLDIDPGFTQFWADCGSDDLGLPGHDYHFTIAENIGRPECPIPTNGLSWLKTRQPVVVEDWPVSGQPSLDRFTTVATWRGPYGPIDRNGETYGLKVHQFRKFLGLPGESQLRYEIALDIDPADGSDLKRLQSHGWRIEDPQQVAADPLAFQRYVQTSGAEFSVAQEIYVKTSSGWFSDRTVRYLASGKPALIQDTGFDRTLPTGEGLIKFATMRDAVNGAKSIAENYSAHCRAARRLAERHFDSNEVLGRFVDQTGVRP